MASIYGWASDAAMGLFTIVTDAGVMPQWYDRDTHIAVCSGPLVGVLPDERGFICQAECLMLRLVALAAKIHFRCQMSRYISPRYSVCMVWFA